MKLRTLPRLAAACSLVLLACLPLAAAAAQAGPDDIVFTSNRAGGLFQLYRMRPDGSQTQRLTQEPMEAGEVSWSPDGSKVLFTASRGRGVEIHVADLVSGDVRRLTQGEVLNSSPVWSPDGRFIAFRSFMDKSAKLYLMKADGSDLKRLTASDEEEAGPAFSPDGQRLAYVVLKHPRMPQIKVLDLSSGASRLLSAEPPTAAEQGPVWSPDGKRLAYTVSKNRSNHIHLMSPDGTDKQALTSGKGRYNDPQWSPDGSRLLTLALRDGASRQDIYTIKVNGSNEPQRLTDDGAEHLLARWSADGQRIFFVKFLAGGGKIFSSDSEGRQVRQLSMDQSYDTGIAMCCSRPRVQLASTK